MENNNEHNIKKGHFDAFVHAVGSEIEQAQVRLITAANAQMLFHYWKMGNYILYHQNLHGWGGKIIKKLAQAIRFNYPEKKEFYITSESSRKDLGEALWKHFKPAGHIVVRVYPGGERYQIFVLDVRTMNVIYSSSISGK